MKITSAEDMLIFGQRVAAKLQVPAVIELVGDVGAGKTTFTRGLAQGLGVSEVVTSPSFTISKRYNLPSGGELVHYDFYRLGDPGIMRDELAETLRRSDSVTVIEWGGYVATLLPDNHLRLEIALNADDSRTVVSNQPDFLEKV